MPHSRCNCRCVMCDIWKANHDKKELSVEQISRHADVFQKLNVREIVMSGGEALMHSNLCAFCKAVKEKGRKLTLLSTGLLLEKNAEQVIDNFNEVIISIDGSPDVHNRVRNVPDGFAKIVSG